MEYENDRSNEETEESDEGWHMDSDGTSWYPLSSGSSSDSDEEIDMDIDDTFESINWLWERTPFDYEEYDMDSTWYDFDS